MSYRILVISDTHCGHKGGLTHPRYQIPEGHGDKNDEWYARVQHVLWDWYAETVTYLQPIDLMLFNGDAIDGKGEKDGGNWQLTADRRLQCEIAKAAIDYAQPRKIVFSRGTPYHTGKEENWEDVLAEMVGAFDISSHQWVEHAGVIIDYKHKVSRSVIPHGRHTGPARDVLWNRLHAERGLQPNANILIRSHVHYHVFSGDARKVVITTPAMQVGSDYGERMCSGEIDIGMLEITIEDNERYTWRPLLVDMAFTAPQMLRV